LNYIKKVGNTLCIGATATYVSLEESELLKKGVICEVLLEAVHNVGHALVRNMATIGGNLCHGVSSADIPPALIALDSNLIVGGANGERTMPIEGFFLDNKKTILKYNEILKEIQIPLNFPKNTGGAFMKMARTTVDLAQVNAAARITLSKDECEDVRIVLGAVAPTPIRAKKAEEYLIGKKLDDSNIEETAVMAAGETKPISDIRASAAYRKEVSEVLVKRALKKAKNNIGG
jgi:carbon-monoxide dehydrogenase medium subunit